jgi:radical SAM superfamily enzyme YgiQ (UPF0313 family)
MKIRLMKKRKALLVVLPYLVASNLDKTKKGVRSFVAFPYGIMTLATYVKKHSKSKSECEVLDLNLVRDDDCPPSIADENVKNAKHRLIKNHIPESLGVSSEDEIGDISNSIDLALIRKISDYQPDIIGFSMSFDVSYKYLNRLSDLVFKNFGESMVQVVGGPAASTAYAEILDRSRRIDAVCFSEGELGFTSLLDSEDVPKALLNDPWITRETLYAKSHKAVVTEDLNEVIDIDYSVVPVSGYNMKEAFSPFTYQDENSKQFFIVTSRGCPFKCNFCAEPMFHGSGMRYASTEKVFEHVKKLVDNYNLTVLTIYDDQILMNKDRAKELFSLLSKLKIRIEMPNGVTLSYIDAELAQILKSAGVDTLFLAIESGSKRVLKDIIRKPISFDRIKPTVKLLQDNGIFTSAFWIFGLPGETQKDRDLSKKLIYEAGLDWSFFNYASPLRGSALYVESIEKGWLPQKYRELGSIDMTEYVLESPGIDKESLELEMLSANLEFNFVKNYRFRIGDFHTSIRSFREVIDRHYDQPFAHFALARSLYFENGEILNREVQSSLDDFRHTFQTNSQWGNFAYLLHADDFYTEYVAC